MGRNYQKLPFTYHVLAFILITLAPVNFEDYLISKKINSIAFHQAEPALWKSWETEFAQMHPNSFTAQKLYLINPIRRKYTLTVEVVKKEIIDSAKEISITPSPSKPSIAKPMMRPKPKMN